MAIFAGKKRRAKKFRVNPISFLHCNFSFGPYKNFLPPPWSAICISFFSSLQRPWFCWMEGDVEISISVGFLVDDRSTRLFSEHCEVVFPPEVHPGSFCIIEEQENDPKIPCFDCWTRSRVKTPCCLCFKLFLNILRSGKNWITLNSI